MSVSETIIMNTHLFRKAFRKSLKVDGYMSFTDSLAQDASGGSMQVTIGTPAMSPGVIFRLYRIQQLRAFFAPNQVDQEGVLAIQGPAIIDGVTEVTEYVVKSHQMTSPLGVVTEMQTGRSLSELGRALGWKFTQGNEPGGAMSIVYTFNNSDVGTFTYAGQLWWRDVKGPGDFPLV